MDLQHFLWLYLSYSVEIKSDLQQNPERFMREIGEIALQYLGHIKTAPFAEHDDTTGMSLCGTIF